MRKPVSKHALRRAMSKVRDEGRLDFREPEGAVIDRIWHELERESYNGARKRSIARDTVRTMPTAGAGDVEDGTV